ncbi:DUF2891 family protein [Nannocystaceae bacterium ST9]
MATRLSISFVLSAISLGSLGSLACAREQTSDDEVAASGEGSEETTTASESSSSEGETTSDSGSTSETSGSDETSETGDTNDTDLTPTDVVSGLGCASELPADSDARWQEFLDRREGWLHALAEPVLACVAEQDTEHPAFHGCIDWHSAVHGTYALHALYRMTGEPLYLDAADAVLDPEAIAGELADIEADALPPIELLYGRAWFLLLARERELAGAGEELRPHAEAIADQLESTLAAASPAQLDTWLVADDYFSASWALLNLWRWSVHVGDAARVAWIEGLVADVATGVDCPLIDEIGFEDDFFPPCLHRAMLVLEVLPVDQAAQWLAAELPGPGEFPLEPLCMPSPAHTAGLNFSRAWGLWSIWRTSGDSHYRDLYVEHVFRHVEQPDYWAEDYGQHAHWIAQFGIHAISLSWE